MSTSLTSYLDVANLPTLSDEAMLNALEERSDENPSSGSGITFLSFSGKTGQYALGRDKDEVDPDDLFIIEPQSIIEGWVCWKGNKPVKRLEWSVYQRKAQAVAEADLEDHGPYRTNMGEGWSPLLGFGVLSTDGKNENIKFTVTSKSGRNAVNDIIEEIKARMRAGDPSMPLIGFDAETFVAQEQKNYKPKFVVDAWVTREACSAYLNGDLNLDELAAGDIPKKKKSRKK
tara:strand:- start:22 stop:714 length:693 start_codon:yes stop_codon:yes gene_type:complete